MIIVLKCLSFSQKSKKNVRKNYFSLFRIKKKNIKLFTWINKNWPYFYVVLLKIQYYVIIWITRFLLINILNFFNEYFYIKNFNYQISSKLNMIINHLLNYLKICYKVSSRTNIIIIISKIELNKNFNYQTNLRVDMKMINFQDYYENLNFSYQKNITLSIIINNF